MRTSTFVLVAKLDHDCVHSGWGLFGCYFEVEVNRVAGAYDTTRRYHITAIDTSGTASSPTPRELYVEHLISQNRNGIRI